MYTYVISRMKHEAILQPPLDERKPDISEKATNLINVIIAQEAINTSFIKQQPSIPAWQDCMARLEYYTDKEVSETEHLYPVTKSLVIISFR